MCLQIINTGSSSLTSKVSKKSVSAVGEDKKRKGLNERKRSSSIVQVMMQSTSKHRLLKTVKFRWVTPRSEKFAALMRHLPRSLSAKKFIRASLEKEVRSLEY